MTASRHPNPHNSPSAKRAFRLGGFDNRRELDITGQGSWETGSTRISATSHPQKSPTSSGESSQTWPGLAVHHRHIFRRRWTVSGGPPIQIPALAQRHILQTM